MFGKCGAKKKMDTEKNLISYNAGKENILLSRFVQEIERRDENAINLLL